MNPVRVEKAWYCPECEAWTRDEPDETIVWGCDAVNAYGLTSEQPREVTAYLMPCCNDVYPLDDVSVDGAWMCSNCESIFSDREFTESCCK